MFQCSVCGNKDPKYIGYLNGRPYCRRCITFKGKSAEINNNTIHRTIKPVLNFRLSKEQKNISNQLLKSYKEGKDSLLYAVCGAGKTELVYETMAYALSLGRHVGVTIPRRDVVVELTPRIRSAFPDSIVRSVYGKHSSYLDGEIIVCTTHQLFRYHNYFDLLIIDETDAFPFQNNYVLEHLFINSIKGNFIMMSATPTESMKKLINDRKGNYCELLHRYHGHPLIVPVIKITVIMSIYLIKKLKMFLNDNKPVLVFCPTIDKAEKLFAFVSNFVKNGNVAHSKKENRDIIVSDFKLRKYKYLVTTSILERGITIKNLQVIVFEANHPIYTSRTLIQISGRVGRKFDAYDGNVIYIARENTLAMKDSIKEIQKANESL